MLTPVLVKMVGIFANLDFSTEEGLIELLLARTEAIMADHDIDELLS